MSERDWVSGTYEPGLSTMVMVEGEPRWADRMPDAWITVGDDGVSRFTAQEPGLYRFDGASVWRVREV